MGGEISANDIPFILPEREIMLKLILAPDFYRFLLKMNFISNGMAKTSVITMNGGGGGESLVANCLLCY